MALSDNIINAESDGDPNATNPNSSASVDWDASISVISASHMPLELISISQICELFFACRPSAIVWRIMSIWIDTVNRMLRARTLAHINEKVFEVAPTLANLNASSPIQIIVILARVRASLDHAAPYLIFRRSFTAPANRNAHAVSAVTFPNHFPIEAAATFSISGLKTIRSNDFFSTAITSAKHLASGFVAIWANDWFSFFNDKKTTKLHSNIAFAG